MRFGRPITARGISSSAGKGAETPEGHCVTGSDPTSPGAGQGDVEERVVLSGVFLRKTQLRPERSTKLLAYTPQEVKNIFKETKEK